MQSAKRTTCCTWAWVGRPPELDAPDELDELGEFEPQPDTSSENATAATRVVRMGGRRECIVVSSFRPISGATLSAGGSAVRSRGSRGSRGCWRARGAPPDAPHGGADQHQRGDQEDPGLECL
jgi:hypothetical protein